MPINTQKFHKKLLDKQRELEEQNKLTEESRQAVELDQQSVGRVSRIDAMQQQAMAQAGEQRRLMELNRIASALERIKAGEYGACLRCGEDIAEKRLAFDPAAILCIDCATS